jgi:glutamate/tyrosine decarboxylase-like PLP-dependent enzyme
MTELPPIPLAYDWERFRREGHKVIDFIADYYQALREKRIPCQAMVTPGFLERQLNNPPVPATGCENFDEILSDISAHIIPGMTHWQHPNFFAFFPAMLSPPALLGDMVASALNQPGFNWVASPAATELEMITARWVVEAFQLPQCFSWDGTGGMVLQPSATEAAVVAMLAAKHRALARFEDGEPRQSAGGKLVAYVSDQAHFCVEKAARILSIPHFRKIRTIRDADFNYPLRRKELRDAIEADVASGLLPFFLSASFGATGICAIDDIADIGPYARERNIWLNVDAAYAGVTCICPELRGMFEPAAESADSILINGSKWFSMQLSSTFMFFRDREHIVASLNASGVYLANEYTDSHRVVDFKDYHLGLGRPFRALKVYTTFRALGVDGIRATIRRHIHLAKYLHKALSADDRLDTRIPPRFGLVCFRVSLDPDNTSTNALLRAINDKSHMFVSTELEGRTIIRVSLAHPGLTEKSMDDLAAHIASRVGTAPGSNHPYRTT